MVKFSVKEELCKGCELCVRACPKKLLQLSPDKLNEKGYHPVMIRLVSHVAPVSALALTRSSAS